MGFSLTLPSIARKTSNGIPRYCGSDIFLLSGEGELVPALAPDSPAAGWRPDQRAEPEDDPVWEVAAYRPRTESGFSRIEQWTSRVDGTSHWLVRTRDNTTWRYGVTAEGRISDPLQPEQIFQWLPEEAMDAHGNKIRYRYKAENDANIPPAIYEHGRNHRTNRYISRIEYGNYLADGKEYFSCQVLFNYGEYSVADPDRKPGEWTARPDPFSTYRSGFEIRTLRRCHSILIYHCFHEQFGGKPFLVRALEFGYEQTGPSDPVHPGLSFMRRVTETGFRKLSDGSYLRAGVPPLVLGYTPFDPRGGSYRKLTVERNGVLPSYLGAGQYLLTDLEGEGLPGILYSGSDVTLFWEPLGDGHYAGPVSLPGFPIESDLSSPALLLTSLEGNGRKDLVVQKPDRAGYYRSDGAGRWEPFRPFASAPANLSSALTEMADMTGSGRADLVLPQPEQISVWPSLGLAGFGPPEQAPSHRDFPVTISPGARELLTFADMFGDGLAHRVRIRDGEIECWPNLGYGAFGPKVTLGNAPRFGPGFDASRLFLADIDGSGPADLIYVRPDCVQVFFSQSGNAFSTPLSIPLPVPYDNLGQVTFGDVNGNGTTCLILTQLMPSPVHYVYDFARDSKPYLLASAENQLGSAVRIRYTTSVRQYLQDKRDGRAWVTRLYFPVQVVERVERTDETTGTRYVTRYRYHDGYYDLADRQFRGFGSVETWDTEEYSDFLTACRASSGAIRRIREDLYVPSVYTRTWFHTGAFFHADVISRQYEREYWHGDPDAWALPESRFSAAVDRQDGETLRQAYAALAGAVLRQEVYGLDGSLAASDPYTVAEARFDVRLIQPRDHQQFAVFLVYSLETLTSEYDRVAPDPRVTHELALVVDGFGNVRRSCQVTYPRRQRPGLPGYPEQRHLHVTATEHAYADHPGTDAAPYRWIGIAVGSRQYEIEGLPLPARCFTLSQLRAETDQALRDPLAYGQPFTPGRRQARLNSWVRSFYWDETLSEPLPLGQLGSHGLIHHEEQAVLTPDLAAGLFAGKGDPAELMRDSGYALSDGYWWNRGLIQYYAGDPAAFFLPCRTDGLFAGVDPEGPLNPVTTVTYDAYRILPTGVTQYVRGTGPAPGAIALRVTAGNDYHVLVPWRVTDVNGNVTEVGFDPLGVVVVSTLFGTKNGVPVGDAQLSEYVRQPDPTFGSVLANPARYLQDASAYFFYDLFAWAKRRQPPAAVGIRRQEYVHEPPAGREHPAGRESPPLTAVTYFDGFGRIIANKLRTDPDPGPGLAELWITSGQVTYNNKALVTARCLPYFSPTPAYERHPEPAAALPRPAVYRYDPLGRLIRTDTPKGFFTKVTFSPWLTRAYDEDDTLLDAAYFRDFPEHPVTPEEKAERDALDKAAAFYNTPATAILDTSGRMVRSLADNLGSVSPADLGPIVEGSGITPQEVWDELVRSGYLAADHSHPALAWVTEKLQPYDRTFQETFTRQFGDLAAPLLDYLKESGLTTLRVVDVAGNVLSLTDPRLLYANVTGGSVHRNLTAAYDMTGNALVTHSADAGSRWQLTDVFGNLVQAWDGRSLQTTRTFDRLGRLTQTRISGPGEVPVVTERLSYGETEADPADRNLNGRVYQHYDPAGLVTVPAYALAGQVSESIRRVRADYRAEADWTPAAMAAVARQQAFTNGFRYDALGRLRAQTAPNGVTCSYAYNQAGQLIRAAAELPGGAATIIDAVGYNANGQRTSVRYGNGTATSYSYEETTLRLLAIATGGERRLQDMRFTYDPVGNVTHTENRSVETAFCYPQPVSPVSHYTYDAVYRVVRATGREAPAGSGQFLPFCPPEPEPRRELAEYVEHFRYDDGGNLVRVEHVARDRWERRFEVAPDSNRLAREPYDGNGNPRTFGELRELRWDAAGALSHVALANASGEEFYLYDAAGTRVARIGRRGQAHAEETVYAGCYQVTRPHGGPPGAGLESVSVMDVGTRVCLLERETGRGPGGWSLRYQLDDNLGSVAWETDGQGKPLNYQEYFPYGASAVLAADGEDQAERKEFRYSGTEFGALTGLSYYGARYYSPSHGRWLSPEPMGTSAGLNLYAFVDGNPISKIDTTGEVGDWVAWGAWTVGALSTLAVGGGGGFLLGHGRGVASGVFLGTVAGVTGAVVGGAVAVLAGAATPAIATVAVASAVAAAFGSVVSGPVTQSVMGTVQRMGGGSRTVAAVGTLTSVAIGVTAGLISPSYFPGGPEQATLVSVAAGLGSALLAPGAFWGFAERHEGRVSPLPLRDPRQIVPAVPRTRQGPVNLPANRLLLVMAPQSGAVTAFEETYKNAPAAILRLNPYQVESTANPAYHTVVVHGSQGYVLVPTDQGRRGQLRGSVMRFMPIQIFAAYVRGQLRGFNDNYAIKFISCYGATWGVINTRNAQILADITGRTVYAYGGIKGPLYKGPWKKFEPSRK